MPYDPNNDPRNGFQHWLFDNPNDQSTKDYQAYQQQQGNDKKHAPPPPNYTGAAEKQAGTDQANVAGQTLANRPNQTNAFGSSVNWTQGPDGQWTQSQSLGGPLGSLSNSLQGQAAANMATPFSYNGPGITSGDAARDQAINAAYGQATSRLDPQWQQRANALQSQLLNQGLDPSSEAYQTAMANFGRDRNDAYSSAMNGAIGQGTEAGNSIFQNSLAAHNTAYGEQLGQHEMPLQDLNKLLPFTSQSGFNQAGVAGPTNYLGAAGMQDAADFRNYNQNNQNQAQLYNQLFSLPADVLSMLFKPGG